MKTTRVLRAVAFLSLARLLASPMPAEGASVQCDGTWQVQTTPTNHDFQIFEPVSATASDDAWAVGSYDDYDVPPGLNPLMAHWDGAAWTERDGPEIEKDGNLYGAASTSQTDVWAVGGWGEVPGHTLAEHWDGSEWKIVPSPSPGLRSTGSTFLDVSALSSADVWAVGQRSVQYGDVRTLVEHWDGIRWSVVPSPNIMGTDTDTLYGVTSSSPDDVWAAGFFVGSDQIGQTLAEHWDGTHWQIVPTPNVGIYDNELYAISAVTSSDIWAVGVYEVDPYNGITEALIEHWDGFRWTVVRGARVPVVDLLGVSGTGDGTVWAVGLNGEGGGITERWDGSTWKAVPAQNPGTNFNQLHGVAALSAMSVFAVGEYGNGDGILHALAEYFC